ncbi:MAG: hypothetical protein JW955_20835 [Sedimentisphaerales bacterium]|nr:hypothetical protein [Sedimentisphaerales bacterium]
MVSRIEWDDFLPHACDSDEAAECRQQARHRLKVALSINEDALRAWASVWDEMKPMVTPGGMIDTKVAEGFVPACGWPEFLEKLWLLKHYLDYTRRMCTERA